METGVQRQGGTDGDAEENQFGLWLGDMLRARRMRNIDLANAIGVQTGQVSKWRRGYQRPDTVSCRLIAEALRIPVGEVLMHAGHIDSTTSIETKDPIRDRLIALIERIPSDQLEPFVAVFERMAH